MVASIILRRGPDVAFINGPGAVIVKYNVMQAMSVGHDGNIDQSVGLWRCLLINWIYSEVPSFSPSDVFPSCLRRHQRRFTCTDKHFSTRSQYMR